MHRSHLWTVALLVLLYVVGLSVMGVGSHVLAQPRGQAPRQSLGQVWSEPINLSHSGAASEPVVVAGPDGTLQVFWWDEFDGLTTARWDGEAWSAPVASPILIPQEVREGATPVPPVPIGAMPLLTADASGWAHAWWLGEADEEGGARPLLHSRLTIGGTRWSTPNAVVESALVWHLAADPAGILHLVYVRPLHSDAFPAGVYYRRSNNGGASWSAPQALYETIYFRPLSAEEVHVWVAADGEGQVHVAWDDPRVGRAFITRSTDGGLTWEEHQEVGDPEEGARRVRVVIGREGEVLLLWEASQLAGPCALYQQLSADGGHAWGTRQRVLEDLGTCPEAPEFLRTAEGQVLLATGSGSKGLTLAAWNGAQWSEPKGLGFDFTDPERERRVYLGALRATLAGEALALVGQGQDGEVWFLESQVSALEWAFAPPSPWSEPVDLSQSEGLPGLPAVATDAEGRVHVLWSEATEEGAPGGGLHYAGYSGTRWTQPVEVLRSPEGKANQPALVTVGDRLYAVWSGGRGGEIFYSRAYVRDAYAPDGWSEPQPLPAPGDVGSAPAIVADLVGTLHVIYAVPLNEERGIYYTRSDDGGETLRQSSGQAWSEAQVVFDAAAADWAMADHPSLAVDGRGTLHVAWVRAPLPGNGLPEGIYYTRSTDAGQTWSEPVRVAEGAYDWPRVAATLTGQVHLLWNKVDGNRAWYHEWSTDGGETWALQERVRGFGDVTGPVGLVTDGAGTLHLVGLGHDDAGEPALLYTTWDGEHWGEPEHFRPSSWDSDGPGVAVALYAALGRLDVTFRGETESEEGEVRVDVLYASRAVPAVEVTPEPLFTPQPAGTPTPGPTPTATPTPRPAVNTEAPSQAPPSLSLGPLTLPLLSLGGLVLAALMVVGVLIARGLRVGRRLGDSAQEEKVV